MSNSSMTHVSHIVHQHRRIITQSLPSGMSSSSVLSGNAASPSLSLSMRSTNTPDFSAPVFCLAPAVPWPVTMLSQCSDTQLPSFHLMKGTGCTPHHDVSLHVVLARTNSRHKPSSQR
ncbi:TPA: hypothetical protein ACH3X2_010682 [Trebouxia sp. C0005]